MGIGSTKGNPYRDVTSEVGFDGQLLSAYEKLIYDPLAFVHFNFKWGEGVLKGEAGPDIWQTEVLKRLGNGLKEAARKDGSFRIAIRSGHGVGKTALIAWIILWFMTTRPHPQVVVTANTKAQLDTKTWRELAKWHKLSLNEHWFVHTGTKFYSVYFPKTWFAAAIPWSLDRSEAFAGTHEKHVAVLTDESSAIPDVIQEVIEGAMTTPGALWVATGNPTQNTGWFAECWGKHKDRWATFEVDSRDAKKANQQQLEEWIKAYGIDSDFVRVRVLGKPPVSRTSQFIPFSVIEEAAKRVIHESVYRHEPRILGVDIGLDVDPTVIIKRQGLACFDLERIAVEDEMQLSSIIARVIDEWEPDAVFIDAISIGAGAISRLRQLGYEVIDVKGSRRAAEFDAYKNKRCEMWAKMFDWLKLGGSIPHDKELMEDLQAPEYSFDDQDRLVLERKVDVRARLGRSPDAADALAMTFAESVAPRQRLSRVARQFAKRDYDVLAYQ